MICSGIRFVFNEFCGFFFFIPLRRPRGKKTHNLMNTNHYDIVSYHTLDPIFTHIIYI